MDLLFRCLKFIWKIITWGPPEVNNVEMALAPLAAAGLALAGGAALGGINHALGAKERRRLRRREDRLAALRGESMGALNRQISDVLGQAGSIDTDATGEEIYGQSIQSLTDRAQAGGASAGAQLAKSVMAGGGDVTGSINSMLQKLTASTNRSIQDIMSEYNERVDRRNLQQGRRQDQLIQSALGARQNQFAALSGAYENAATRSAQKATADKQFLMDALGLGANVGSMFYQGPGGGS